MICHYDAITCCKSLLLCLKEIIGLIKMNCLLPSLSQFLMPFQLWVVCYKYSLIIVNTSKNCRRVGCATPRKIKNMTLKELPCVSKILSKIEFLVDLAWLVINEVGARGPSCCKGPLSLGRMIVELMYLLSTIECSKISSTVLSYPINTISP